MTSRYTYYGEPSSTYFNLFQQQDYASNQTLGQIFEAANQERIHRLRQVEEERARRTVNEYLTDAGINEILSWTSIDINSAPPPHVYNSNQTVERTDDMPDEVYYRITDKTLTLYNWLNPKSEKYPLQFTFALDNYGVSRKTLEGVMKEAVNIFLRDFSGPIPITAEKRIITGYYGLVESNKKNPIECSIPSASIGYLMEKFDSARRTHERQTIEHRGAFEQCLSRCDPTGIASYLMRMQEHHIKASIMEDIKGAFHALEEGKISEAFFRGNNNMYDYVMKSLAQVVGSSSRMFDDKESRWQYKVTAMMRRLGADQGHALMQQKELKLTYSKRSPGSSPVLRITKHIPAEVKDRKINLKALYPGLKYELKELKRDTQRNSFRDGMSTSVDWSTMQHFWNRYNEIKNKLMFLGYSEQKASRAVSLSAWPKQPLTFCELTKQHIPACFSVSLDLYKGPRVLANIYYLYVNNANGEMRQNRYIWEPHHATEVELAPQNYYLSGVRNHTRNVLEFLSVRSMENENVMVYGKNKTYRPVPYMGIELEVERNPNMVLDKNTGMKQTDERGNYIPVCKEQITEDVYDSLGRDYVILKRDGSLRGHAPFEIVTVPATLEYHQSRWKNFLNDATLKSQLQSFSSGNCGMHVHMSRDSFNGLHLAKFMRFLNAKDNHNFVTKIAQRSGNAYSRFEDNTIKGHLSNIHLQKRDETRRVAVNCTNQNTIEVRIFRGNLAKVAFLRNLEFVHAIYAYTKDASMSDLGYKKFLFWLFDSCNETKAYKHLKVWLVSAGYNVTNIPIKKGTSDEATIKIMQERKKIKKAQLIIDRRYKPKEDTLKFGGREAITKDEILASA